MPKATAYSTTSETVPVRTVAASAASATARTPLAAAIARARSTRSTTAPAGRANSSQGRKASELSAETATGSRVREAASSGSATRLIPSARFDDALEIHNRQNLDPSDGCTPPTLPAASDIPSHPGRNRMSSRGRTTDGARLPTVVHDGADPGPRAPVDAAARP